MRPRALVAAFALVMSAAGARAAMGRATKPGSVSPLVGRTIDRGLAPRHERHAVVVGLELRNHDDLEAFLADVQDPRSPRYHRFLTPDEFAAFYAPAPEDEALVVAHLAASGLEVTDRFPNRLLVRAEGDVAALKRAFGVRIHHVEYGGRMHYAALAEPSVPAALAGVVTGVVGLDDLTERRPHLASVTPAAALGAFCCALAPQDLATFYDDSAGYDGSGETIVIAGAYAWTDADNADFATQWALPALPAGSGQVCSGASNAAGCKFSSQNSIEVALDVEYAHGTAPGARILNYMAASTANSDFTTLYNRIVTDNPGHVVTTSWGACEVGLSTTAQQIDDAIFASANAIGQSWFAASGDNGSLDCSNTLSVDNPANSPHVIGVGGTTPTCSGGLTSQDPGCAGYGSEAGWSGSGGGISGVFARPAFQMSCGVPAGASRLVPDVALEADTSPGEYVLEGGSWYLVGGTSGAAPQWAGYLAELDQKAGGSGFGNPGALLYGLCGTPAFHDVLAGSNGTYAAGSGYDMVTGLGTIDANQLLALAVPTTTTTSPTTTTHTSTTTPSTSTTTHATTSSTATTTPTTGATSSTTMTGPPITTTTVIASSTTSTSGHASTTTTARAPSTTTTTLAPGACVPGGCDDGDPCTVDGCSPDIGCTHDQVTGLLSVTCVCARLLPGACLHDTIPKVIRRRQARSCTAIARAARMTEPRRRKARLQATLPRLRGALGEALRATDSGRLSPACGLALEGELRDDIGRLTALLPAL